VVGHKNNNRIADQFLHKVDSMRTMGPGGTVRAPPPEPATPSLVSVGSRGPAALLMRNFSRASNGAGDVEGHKARMIGSFRLMRGPKAGSQRRSSKLDTSSGVRGTAMRRRSVITTENELTFRVSMGDKKESEEVRVYEIALKEVRLARQIGIGSFGEVYVGVWRGHRVAVKRLLLDATAAKSVREIEKEKRLLGEFRREIAIMSKLSHVNVLALIGAVINTRIHVMVIEYMANGTVYSWIRSDEKEFTDTNLLSFATDCATGMEHV